MFITALLSTLSFAAGVDVTVQPKLQTDQFEVWSLATMQTPSGSGLSTAVTPLVPHAPLWEAQDVEYDQVCIHVSSAGPVGSTNTLMVFAPDITGVAVDRIWTSAPMPNDAVGLTCASTTDVASSWDVAQSTTHRSVSDYLRLDRPDNDVLFVAIVRSAGTNNVAYHQLLGTKPIGFQPGSTPTGQPTPFAGLSIATADLGLVLDPADISPLVGRLPAVYWHAVR